MYERIRKHQRRLLQGMLLVGLVCVGGPATAAPRGEGARRQARQASRKLVALMVEHDDLSIGGTTRHLIRATVPVGLSPDELRRNLDLLLDEERLTHPQVDAVALYLYEEPVYARFRGRATPLTAAVAHAEWAPGGDWNTPARALSQKDNRLVYSLPGPRPAGGPPR